MAGLLSIQWPISDRPQGRGRLSARARVAAPANAAAAARRPSSCSKSQAEKLPACQQPSVQRSTNYNTLSTQSIHRQPISIYLCLLFFFFSFWGRPAWPQRIWHHPRVHIAVLSGVDLTISGFPAAEPAGLGPPLLADLSHSPLDCHATTRLQPKELLSALPDCRTKLQAARGIYRAASTCM